MCFPPHLCSVSSQNLTYEIILTLGQAFEVAYQLALQAQKSRPMAASAAEMIETKSSKPVPKPRVGMRKSAVRGPRRQDPLSPGPNPTLGFEGLGWSRALSPHTSDIWPLRKQPVHWAPAARCSPGRAAAQPGRPAASLAGSPRAWPWRGCRAQPAGEPVTSPVSALLRTPGAAGP